MVKISQIADKSGHCCVLHRQHRYNQTSPSSGQPRYNQTSPSSASIQPFSAAEALSERAPIVSLSRANSITMYPFSMICALLYVNALLKQVNSIRQALQGPRVEQRGQFERDNVGR
ncbi:hypothetical protein E6O75_ATG02220 [Venturia nashicola]|uniref:Uncharacterized protein n=1 Tax=Venturia nashicola TaxID=86259 RepID=A0A4Z1PD55_9PEZI|nr:hypothetical protein E6O75_ATG02220 [Venturia nashicola]